MNPNEPLWLPPGSVRSLLALFVVIVGVGYLIFVDQAEAVIGFVGLALGYYFGMRTNDTQVDDGGG